MRRRQWSGEVDVEGEEWLATLQAFITDFTPAAITTTMAEL